MLFGRRKPGYTTTVDAASDPEQVILDLQKAEMAAKKKPKAEVFDIDAASETARRLKETGSMFDGSAAKLGEDVIAAVQKETDALAAKQAEAQPAPEETAAPDAAEKPQLLDFLAAAPEAEGDPYADQPTVTAPELPELTPAQELAGYIRSRSAAALVTSHALLAVKVFYHTRVFDHHDQRIPIGTVGMKILPNRAIVFLLVYAGIYIIVFIATYH